MRVPKKFSRTRYRDCILDDGAYAFAKKALRWADGDPELALFMVADLWVSDIKNRKQEGDERDKSIEL